MENQIIQINLVPNMSTPAVVRVSQYDVGRPLVFKVYDGTSPADLTGVTAMVEGTKRSGLGFSESGTVSDNTVTLDTTIAMTQEDGSIPAEIRFTKTGEDVGTANFILAVEKSPHLEGTTDGTTETMADLQSQLDALDERVEAIEEGGGGGGLTDDIKTALLQIAQKVAYIDEHGQTYYNNLYDALYAIQSVTVSPTRVGLTTIGATSQLIGATVPSGGTITWTSSDTSVATVSSTGLVTSVGYGTATITASSGGKSATCSVVVSQAELEDITAVYTQSGTVYDTDSLDSLKADLVVTANYSGGTSETIPSSDYTLSGTLTEGTSTITVSYGGLTATFDVTVTVDDRPWKSLSIANDFVDGTAWGTSYSSTYGQYCVSNTGRCCYGKFEFYLEAGYKYVFEHDSATASQKFGIISGEKTTATTTAIENHASLSGKMSSDSGWQASGYIMTPSVDTYVAIQFNVTATALQNAGCTELRIRKVAV